MGKINFAINNDGNCNCVDAGELSDFISDIIGKLENIYEKSLVASRQIRASDSYRDENSGVNRGVSMAIGIIENHPFVRGIKKNSDS